MKEVVVLEKEEYQDLTKEIRELRKYKSLFRRLYNNEHHYKNDTLVIKLDVKELSKLLGYDKETNTIIILKE